MCVKHKSVENRQNPLRLTLMWGILRFHRNFGIFLISAASLEYLVPGVICLMCFGWGVSKTNKIGWNGWLHLVVILLAFFAGAVAGFFLAFLREASSEFQSFLSDYLYSSAHGDFKVSFFSVLWDCFCWPLATIVFSFSAIGVVLIPIFLLVRGFLLSYAISCFASFLGVNGIAIIAVLFSAELIFVVPVTFLFAYEGIRSACFRLPGAAASTNCGQRHLEVLLIGLGILSVAVAVQWAIIPNLFSSVCARLF